MPRLIRIGLALASVLALGLGSRVAHAQVTPAPTSTTTTTTTGIAMPCSATATMATVSSSEQTAPERFLHFGTPQQQDLGQSTRPNALNPLGINFDDCIEDMTLEFRLTGCDFNGSEEVQVWASTSTDCTQPSERGVGQASVCWLVSQGSLPVQTSGSLNYDIRVQDIVGPQALSPSPTTIVHEGPSACSAQSTFLAVPININFVPLTPGSGALAGQAYQYTLQTDLVGPPAPAGVGIKDGDTLFVVNWTPNIDTDTGGYDVLIDPIPGQEGDAAVVSSGAGTTQLVCPAEAGMSTSDAEAEAGGADDGAATDATLSDASGTGGSDATVNGDSGCYTITKAGSGTATPGSTGACGDSLLTSGAMFADGGTPVTTAPTEVDDAGNVIETDAATVESTGAGGIFTPPVGHVLNPDPTLGTTATGQTNSTFTIKGLTNGVTYHVVVAAVDNFGNVGPPSSPPQCDFPAPVNDFWKIYRTDGGQAGGGFCALEAVGAPAGSTVAFAGAGALVIAGLRRRRSRRR